MKDQNLIAKPKPQKFYYRRVRCQYCNQHAKVVEGSLLYGDSHKLSDNQFYYCEPCSAWVGMHNINKKPLGSLANAELRKKRVTAHSLFDRIWIAKIKRGYSKSAARQEAYKWLSDSLGIPFEKCHIGYFNVEECNKVISLCLRNRA